jgi:hypothetical protein
MRIKGHNHRCAAGGMGVARRGGNNRLVSAVNTVEDTDSQEERSPKRS